MISASPVTEMLRAPSLAAGSHGFHATSRQAIMARAISKLSGPNIDDLGVRGGRLLLIGGSGITGAGGNT